jgi:hypothetical protein
MKYKILLTLLGLFLCFSSFAQTNVISTNSPVVLTNSVHTDYPIRAFVFLNKLRSDFANPTNCYGSRETVFEFAPTISSPNISSYLNKPNGYTIGYSFEVEHWTSPFMGTGFEIGTYDYKQNTIDHIAIMEDFRYVPFQGYYFWNRLAVGFKTGAETFFPDGSKDLELGAEIYWHFSKNTRFECDIIQHQRTDSSKNGQTARFALQWIF